MKESPNFEIDNIPNSKPFISFDIMNKENFMNRSKNSELSDESEILTQLKEHQKISLSTKMRWFVFSLFLTSNILISMDHGSIPASTEELRRIIISYDQGIGLFGSLVYVGNIIGSGFIMTLINKYNRKYLLLIALFINALCLFTFILYNNIPFLFTNRVIVGIFQAYITIYMPVWCNQYGERQNRTMMIAFIQLVSPIGIFLGYSIAAVAIQERYMGGWTFAFLVQSILIVLLCLIFVFVPQIYFDPDLYSYTDSLGKEEFRKIVQKIGFQKKENLSIKKIFSIIIKKKIFIYSVLGLSVLIYVITGVQYWISDYMLNVLMIINAKKRLFFFTLVCFTSPTFGILLGTYTKNTFCKNMTESLIFCNILGVLASIPALIVAFISNSVLFLVFLWLTLFFGGGIVPIITTIIITAVPKTVDASGNSITNFITNLLGYLPAPYIYGICSDILQDKGVIGMRITMSISILGVFFISLATYNSYQKDQKRTN